MHPVWLIFSRMLNFRIWWLSCQITWYFRSEAKCFDSFRCCFFSFIYSFNLNDWKRSTTHSIERLVAYSSWKQMQPPLLFPEKVRFKLYSYSSISMKTQANKKRNTRAYPDVQSIASFWMYVMSSLKTLLYSTVNIFPEQHCF